MFIDSYRPCLHCAVHLSDQHLGMTTCIGLTEMRAATLLNHTWATTSSREAWRLLGIYAMVLNAVLTWVTLNFFSVCCGRTCPSSLTTWTEVALAHQLKKENQSILAWNASDFCPCPSFQLLTCHESISERPGLNFGINETLFRKLKPYRAWDTMEDILAMICHYENVASCFGKEIMWAACTDGGVKRA